MKTYQLIFCALLTTGVWCDTASFKETFTTNLLKELASSGENVVFSPASMDTALSLVVLGAKGPTRSELLTTMGYNEQDAKEVITQKQKNLNEKPGEGAIWQSANRILVSPDFPLKQEYVTEVNQTFPGVAVGNFNFDAPEKTANEVNSWVSEKTNNVIQKLIEPSSVNPNTRLIILNAVYFKGQWKHGFDKKRTKKQCFYSEPGKCIEVDMMHIKEDFKYGYHNEMKAQIIEFPYKDENFSMVVVLPDESQNNLKNLIANLNVDDVIDYVNNIKWPVEVHVTLPKFEIEFKKEMKLPLMNMGIKNVFTDASDLSGMVSGLRASVDSVIHKAKITCDEEGTVAAAATGVQITLTSARISPDLYFNADRPFIYMIKNKKSGILFGGTYSKVNEK